MNRINLYWLWLAVAFPCIGAPLAVAFALIMCSLHNTIRLGTVGTSERLRFGLGSLLRSVTAIAVGLALLRSVGAMEDSAGIVLLFLSGYLIAVILSAWIARHLRPDEDRNPTLAANYEQPQSPPPTGA